VIEDGIETSDVELILSTTQTIHVQLLFRTELSEPILW